MDKLILYWMFCIAFVMGSGEIKEIPIAEKTGYVVFSPLIAPAMLGAAVQKYLIEE